MDRTSALAAEIASDERTAFPPGYGPTNGDYNALVPETVDIESDTTVVEANE